MDATGAAANWDGLEFAAPFRADVESANMAGCWASWTGAKNRQSKTARNTHTAILAVDQRMEGVYFRALRGEPAAAPAIAISGSSASSSSLPTTCA
jgi:hypothetical protein